MERKIKAFVHLLEIMDELRKKCPWDREQTLESLRKLTIEETYELSDAILKNDLQGIEKELGDLMLHIVFYAKIGSEKNAFDMADVLEGINEKLIFRHPHVLQSGCCRFIKRWKKTESAETERKGKQTCFWKEFHRFTLFGGSNRIQKKPAGGFRLGIQERV